MITVFDNENQKQIRQQLFYKSFPKQQLQLKKHMNRLLLATRLQDQYRLTVEKKIGYIDEKF